MKDFLVFLLLFTVVVILIIVGPLVLIWAISILAEREPIYTGWTWLAAFLVIVLLGRPGHNPSK